MFTLGNYIANVSTNLSTNNHIKTMFMMYLEITYEIYRLRFSKVWEKQTHDTLYKIPFGRTTKLPVVCLLSRKNNTGQ